jgi:pilus assembly protein CpaB
LNPKRIALAFVLAVAIAGVVSYAFYARVRSQRAESGKAIKVVAATKPMSAGSPITVDSVALIDWPANMPLSGAFSKLDEVIGRSLIYPINEHQPILDRDVALAGSGIGLTVKIPEGMRAVSVRSNDVVGVAGFLYPGSRVDVLVTSKIENSSTRLTQTQTILPNVEVLVAGQKIEPDPTGKPETVNVVTLLLKPEDGEKLVLASTQGAIQFVLRNGADQKSPETRPVDMADLMTGIKRPVLEKKAEVKGHPRVVKAAVFHEVETISGSKKSVDKFD